MTLSEKLKNKIGVVGGRLNYIGVKGLTAGANSFLKTYEYYRIIIGIIFLGSFAYYFFSGNSVMAFVSFGFFHLHVFLNQIWWKLKGLEQHGSAN